MLFRITQNTRTITNDILDLFPIDTVANGTFLDPAMGGGQFVREVERIKREHGKTSAEIRDSVFGLEEKRGDRDIVVNKYRLSGTYSWGDFLSTEINMRFDNIAGNPPFSKANEGKTAGKRSVNLYPEFYRKSIELADRVAMIMPDTKNQINSTHNRLIKETANDIITIDPVQFPNVGIKMWTVFYDRTKSANVDHHFADLRVANNIEFIKGKINLSVVKNSVRETAGDDTVRVVKAVYKSTGVENVYVDSSVVKPQHQLPHTGYVVICPLTMNRDWRVEIEPCQGQVMNVNVTYVLANTEEEAQMTRDLLTSSKFIERAKPLRGNQGVMTIAALKSVSLD
jgi:hypothetical protein